MLDTKLSSGYKLLTNPHHLHPKMYRYLPNGSSVLVFIAGTAFHLNNTVIYSSVRLRLVDKRMMETSLGSWRSDLLSVVYYSEDSHIYWPQWWRGQHDNAVCIDLVQFRNCSSIAYIYVNKVLVFYLPITTCFWINVIKDEVGLMLTGPLFLSQRAKGKSCKINIFLRRWICIQCWLL